MTQEEQWKAICLWDSGSGSIFFSSQVTICALKTRFSRAPSVNSGKHIHHSYLNLVPGHQSSKQYIYLHLVNKLRTPSITATISSSHLSTRKKSRIIQTNTRSNLKNLTPMLIRQHPLLLRSAIQRTKTSNPCTPPITIQKLNKTARKLPKSSRKKVLSKHVHEIDE